jgi:hypothetical protein
MGELVGITAFLPPPSPVQRGGNMQLMDFQDFTSLAYHPFLKALHDYH